MAFKSRNRPSLFVHKSRTEADARKEDSVIFVLISRTNFSRNFVRDLKDLPHIRAGELDKFDKLKR